MAPVQYVILRKGLQEQHGTGTLVAQAMHATWAPISGQLRGAAGSIEDLLSPDTRRWIDESFAKVVLEADEKDMRKLMSRLDAAGVSYRKIEESRLGGQLTAIGVEPYEKAKVQSLFKGLQTLKDRKTNGSALRCIVDDAPIDVSDLTYEPHAIDTRIPDLNHRFSLQVPFADFVSRFGPTYDHWRDTMRREGGTADDRLDKGSVVPALSYLHKNDPAFNNAFIETHYVPMLHSLLSPAENKPYVITSIDGLFSTPDTLFIYGGCSTRT